METLLGFALNMLKGDYLMSWDSSRGTGTSICTPGCETNSCFIMEGVFTGALCCRLDGEGLCYGLRS
jgi:hypothetical protein